jgi:single-strand DNA-binding protein
MLKVILAGRLGRDAQFKTLQDGTGRCSFAVACDVGFGERKQTYWVDVTKWGKGAEGLTRYLTKGTSVAVVGELSTREHEGKTYLQCRADDVTIQGGGGQRQEPTGGAQAPSDALDDDIPF